VDPYQQESKTGIWGIGRNTGLIYRLWCKEQLINYTTYDSTRGIYRLPKTLAVMQNKLFVFMPDHTLIYAQDEDQKGKRICFEQDTSEYIDLSGQQLFMRGVFNGNVFSQVLNKEIKDVRYYALFGYNYKVKDYFKYPLPIANLASEDFITSYHAPTNQFWVSALGMVIRMNSKDSVLPTLYMKPYIRQVRVTADSLLLEGMLDNYTYASAIPYNLNDIQIKFAAPYFNHEELTRYRYWLEGRDETWSSWSLLKEHTFGNLSEGKYVLHIQAANLFGQLSEETTFLFTISPPWYRTIWAYLGYVIGAVLLVVLIVYISLRRLRKHKNVLEKLVRERTVEVQTQKEKLQQVVGDLHDSINYAKRIQDALLPRRSHYEQYLPQSFVFLSPKDIVSGDFHWLDVKNNAVYVAAADCTGHGVPGALMSVVGFNLLDQALHEANLLEPAQILSHLDRGVNKLLRQSDRDSEVKDGMDIAICRIDFEQMELQYAGAFNPLYWIRNGDLFQFKADKDPIGSNENNVADHYTNHKIKLEKNEMIYIFSDGFADQFGGPFGKKFKYAPFRELLLSVHQLPLEKQHEKMKEAFFGWKKEYEQVDDVLVIGIRI
ncbi:MAG: SpoIIE family protein phosphatase, partial [Bacteroidia bacterium]